MLLLLTARVGPLAARQALVALVVLVAALVASSRSNNYGKLRPRSLVFIVSSSCY